MAELTAFITNAGVPLVAPVDAPTIEIRRSDTQAIVQAAIAMTDQANGLWSFTFAITNTALDFTFQVDADPNGTGQVTNRERFYGGSFGGDVDFIDGLREFIEGGRDIDFAGNDALGWQRIERDVGGTLLRRYNLFDETGARITGTVAAFIAAKKMISSEVAI